MVTNYANKNTSKLLVAVLAMLMIVAGAAVVLGEETSATPGEVQADGSVTVTNSADLDAVLKNENSTYDDVTTILLGAEEFKDDAYKQFTVNRALTIKAAEGFTPTVYGGFVVDADGAVFEKLTICPYGELKGAKTGIAALTSNITVKDCTFVASADTLSNGIYLFPETANFTYVITGNDFKGFNVSNTQKWDSIAIGFASNFDISTSTGQYGLTGTSVDFELTAEKAAALYSANTFSDSSVLIEANSWTTGDPEDGVVVPGEITPDYVSYGENNTVYIPKGLTVTIDEPTTITGDIVVDGNLRNKSDLTFNGQFVVNGKFTNTADGTVDGANGITGSGSVINDGVMNAAVEVADYTNNATADLVVYGDSTGSQWYPAKQNITVPAGQTWTIIKDNIIVIPGNLNVEGNLVIEDGGVLVVGGILSGAGTEGRTGFGSANIEGTLTIEELGTLAVAYGNVDVNGTADIDGTVYIGYGYQTMNPVVGTDKLATTGYENVTANLNLNSDTSLSDSSVIMQNVVNNGATAQDVKATKTAVVVAQGVSLTMKGTIGSALVINNSGTVTFDSEPTNDKGEAIYLNNRVSINTLEDGAVVDFQNLAMSNTGAVIIDDSNLVVKSKDKVTASAAGVSSRMKFDTNNTSAVISGLVVVENFDGVKNAGTADEEILISMDISGTISASAADKKVTDVAAQIYLAGGFFTVSDAGEAAALAVGDDCTLTIAGGSELTVSGYVPVSYKKDHAGTITNDGGVITLAGNGHIYMIEAAGNEIAATVNAAHYLTTVDNDDFRNYVTFDAALAAANADSTIDEIRLFGENKMTVSATLPAITLTFEDNSSLAVGDEDNRDVTLTVTADADYGAEEATTVYGTVYFNDRRDLANEGNMISDVKSYEVDAEGKEVKDGWARYTNIYTAMTEAEAGDVITVSKAVENPTDPKDAYVQLTSDFTVKAGVTVVIPDEANIKGIMVMDGVTLTVAGTLQSDIANGVVAESAFAKNASNEKDKETSAIVVTGTLKVVDDVAYAAADPAALTNDLLTEGSYISGAYYYDGEYYYVSPLSVAVNNLADVITDIEIEGTVTEGDVTFTATDECDTIQINAGAQLTLSSLTLANGGVLKNVDQTYADDTEKVTSGWFTGTVTVGDASIEAVKVTGLDITSENGLVIEGAVVDYTEPTDKANPKKQLASLTAVAGTVVVDKVTKDMTVGENATVTVPNVTTGTVNTDGNVDGALTVLGTVTVGNGQTLTVDEMYVAGTVSVAEQTDTDMAGKLNVGTTSNNSVYNGTLFVGMDEDFEVIGADAAVNGPVNCTTIYAAAGTAVSEATADAETFDNSTEYYVEGALWMTAYTQAENLPIADTNGKIKDAVPVENAWFDGTWLEEDGTKIAAENNNEYVGDVSAVYAQVTYDIYVINLKADHNAISSITIDGSVMNYGMIYDAANKNYYYGYTAIVDAGSHSVQYQLANGYSGNGVLTVNGTQMSDLTFTTEGTPTSTDGVQISAGVYGIEYNLQLTGFEKSGYVPDSPDTGSDSGDSGMTITDYLLIVLVVLIIVMAIIVAMRLS